MPDSTPPSSENEIAPLLRLALEEEPPQAVTMPMAQTGEMRDASITDAGAVAANGAGTASSVPPQNGSARRWQPPTVEALQQMLPQYEVSTFLARGGMGAVYKGTQKTLKRPVAIKVLPPDIEDGDLQFAARFKHEAQAMARLSHPNIVAVFDAGETAEGLLYFVMEFIEGTDVAQLIASEGRLEPLRAIQITTAVCEALAFAHDEGIVHRDIKPSNIMIDRKGRVKVADFGLAKTVNVETTMLTGSNMTMGTPDFIAPEAMIAGMQVDQRADIYAVGVMLYQMLTGHIPRGRFLLPSSVVPQVDKRFDAIVDKAMQTDREQRYSTALEMKTDVEKVSRSGGLPQSSAASPTVASRRHLTKPLVALAVMIAAAGAYLVLRESNVGQAVGLPEAVSATRQGAPLSPSASPAKQTLDLITLVDVQRDRLRAEGNAGANVWTKSGGQLVFSSGDKRPGKISAPVALNGLRDYEIEIGVPTAAPDPIGVDLPISATSQATVAFMPGQVVLLRDGNTSKVFGNWPKEASSPPWKLATRIKFDADGINGTISATVNGTALGEWRGALGRLGKTTEPHPDFPGQLVPALYVPNGDRIHSSWTLRVFEGEAKVLRGAASTPAPIAATKDKPYTNTLGMKFVPVPGTDILLCIHETRKGDYAKYAAEGPGVKDGWKNPMHKGVPVSEGDDHPVVSVSWDEAKAFCAWLSEKENRTYRLPTDREWSVAVGIAGDEREGESPESLDGILTNRYPWGTAWPPPKDAGNYADTATKEKIPASSVVLGGYTDGFATTAPVMSFKPNRLGLYDLSGNVWEWCEDWSNAEEKEKVKRGGSWDHGFDGYLNLSGRAKGVPRTVLPNAGFRCALVLSTGHGAPDTTPGTAKTASPMPVPPAPTVQPVNPGAVPLTKDIPAP